MPGTKVHVVLCPNHQYLDKPAHPSWPHPAHVQVELVGLTDDNGTTAPARTPIRLGATNDKGITDATELEAGCYRVQLADYDFFEGYLDVAQADRRRMQTHEVRLAPSEENDWLVLLQLMGPEPNVPVSGVTVQMTDAGGSKQVMSAEDGFVYATYRAGDDILPQLQFDATTDGRLIPSYPSVSYLPPAQASSVVTAQAISYSSPIEIAVTPVVNLPTGSSLPLVGTSVTVEYLGTPGIAIPPQTLEQGQEKLSFTSTLPGMYRVSATPPLTVPTSATTPFSGFPIKNTSTQSTPSPILNPGSPQWVWSPQFDVVPTTQVQVVVATPQDQPLAGPFALDVVSPEGSVPPLTVSSAGASYPMTVPEDGTLTFQIDSQNPPQIKGDLGNIPAVMSEPGQQVVTSSPDALNTINLAYLHSVTGQVVDEHGQTMPGATIEIILGNQSLGVVAADAEGNFEIGLPTRGTYHLSQYPKAGPVGRQESVTVNSNGGPILIHANTGLRAAGGGGTGREALTDLAAYPVLTEEISTTGPPAPVTGGGPAASGPGAGYGQTVEQVMRDVLGWRPSGDVAGFQAALTGAFQLRQVEGHTEWSWQQRGYAVQADMGALTGAQASIYARAKSALDQILPLLAGLTAINPSLYPPQDLEAIRTVVTAELQELVNELALQGGPRIRRVDELFRLLSGESRKSLNPNPDAVQGQLGTLRDRFGLTVANVETVDEERIVTNFRVVVEQVLTLQQSWESDRKLLSVLDSNTSLGTILIWLSRGLEAVCESVDDLTFALDSVFVDAAQRQVIQLNFTGVTLDHLPKLPLWKGKTVQPPYSFLGKQAPILLSDLLDWVVRASRDEGPKIVQDAGKDGVLAFAPILNELRILIHGTRKLTHTHQGASLPDGVRTPRVRRALEVLAAQLDEAANLAALVKRDGLPEITGVTPDPITWSPKAPTVNITLTGTNFRRHSSVFLSAANREDVPDIPASGMSVTGHSQATATFKIPRLRDAGGRLDWQVVLTNEDGSSTEPVAITLHES
jgi:hypothetical protein